MNKLFKKFIKPLCLIVIFLITLNFYFAYDQNKKIENRITSGRIQYFPKIGWVDWAHARPQGPQELVNSVYANTGVVIYHQQMTKKIWGIYITVRYTNTYYTPTNYSKKGQEGIIHYIFNDVTQGFEDLQGSFPFKYKCGIGIGDINGDNIALLRSLGKSKIDPSIYDAADYETALEMYHQNKDINRVSILLKNRLEKEIRTKKIDSRVEYIFGIKN